MQRHRQTQKKQKIPSEKSKQQVEFVEKFDPETEVFTPDSIMMLQRKLGNQATQKILQRSGIAPTSKQGHILIQRAPTSLRKVPATNRVVKAAHDFANDVANADKPINDLVQEVQTQINSELKGQYVPEIQVVGGAAGNNGEFNFQVWKTELNIASTFGGKAKISELSKDEIAKSVNTLYHESRHGEQWFRIARMRAGKALTKDADDTKRAQVATQIATATFIPQNITLEAAKNPLYESWGSKFGGKKDQAMDEAKGWDKSIYGADATYRNLILAKANTVISAAYAQVTAANNAPNPQLVAEWTKAKTEIGKLVTLKDTEIATEITRLEAIVSRSTVEDTMLQHLNQMKLFITESKTLTDAVATKADIHPVLLKVYSAVTERYQAYKDLPEETDAWATGDTAETKYKNV